MRILVIGGTRFVGHAMAEAALATRPRRHACSTGSQTAELPDATHLLTDRDGDLSVLADGRWDATIDVCAYVPSQVRTAPRGAGRPGWPPPLRLHGVGLPGAVRPRRRPRTRPLFEELGRRHRGGHQRDLRTAQGRLRAGRPARPTATTALDGRSARRTSSGRATRAPATRGGRCARPGRPDDRARPARRADAVHRRPRHGRLDGAAGRGPGGRRLHRGPALRRRSARCSTRPSAPCDSDAALGAGRR